MIITIVVLQSSLSERHHPRKMLLLLRYWLGLHELTALECLLDHCWLFINKCMAFFAQHINLFLFPLLCYIFVCCIKIYYLTSAVTQIEQFRNDLKKLNFFSKLSFNRYSHNDNWPSTCYVSHISTLIRISTI